MSGKTTIFVHNETKTGWNIESTSDSRTKLITKPTKIITGDNSVIEKNLSIGIQTNILVDNILDKMLEAPRKKKSITCNYFSENIAIKFSKKTFDPYVKMEPNSNRRHVLLLISLDLESRKFVSSEGKGCILEYGFNNETNEFNLIVSLDKSNEDPSFRLKMYNRGTKKVTIYNYTIVNDKVKLSTKEIIEKIDTRKRSSIFKYRPNHPTNTIICHKEDVKELEDVLMDKYNKIDNFTCNIYSDNKELDKILRELTVSGYRAITIFQGRKNGKTHRIDKEKIKHFKTTMLFTNTGLKRL